jgi:hypothetical protein
LGVLAVHEALKKLTELFIRAFSQKARFRCGTEGPDEFDLLFESIFDEQFGCDPNSEYMQWVRRLYRRGNVGQSISLSLTAALKLKPCFS